MTNIESNMLHPGHPYRVQVTASTLPSIHQTYADVPDGTPLALLGSAKRLEIAVRNGNAKEALNISVDAPVTLFLP